MTLILKAPDNVTGRTLLSGLKNANIDASLEKSNNETAFLKTENGEQTALSAPYKLGEIIDLAQSLQRNAAQVPKKINIQECVFYPEQSLFEKNDAQQALTEKECALLIELWKVHPNSLDKDHLLERIWEYHTELETHTLETHIYRLRQKIERDPSKPEYLVTEKNGYKLIVQ